MKTIKMLDQVISTRWELQRDAECLLHALGLPGMASFGSCQQRDKRLQAVAAHAQVKDMNLVLQLRHFSQVYLIKMKQCNKTSCGYMLCSTRSMLCS